MLKRLDLDVDGFIHLRKTFYHSLHLFKTFAHDIDRPLFGPLPCGFE